MITHNSKQFFSTFLTNSDIYSYNTKSAVNYRPHHCRINIKEKNNSIPRYYIMKLTPTSFNPIRPGGGGGGGGGAGEPAPISTFENFLDI